MQRILQFTMISVILVSCTLSIMYSSNTVLAGSPDDPQNENSSDTKLKVASGALTLFYLPVKATYAGLGAIVGGIGYVLGGGDEEMGQVVWTPTMKGTYFITPEHLRGDKPVQFFGKAESDTSQFELGRGKGLNKSPPP
ncbi:hypothetical protein [Candidatus Nitronereus thalassa]|uniref:Transmembrane protein n=1 Tax=Candidatus Nitronereus thalassa TaxID=3020898 RepID=A0ABU3K5P0_9BACT|nr:hypothetical protein [Candidatus Nitronereus thalassa]MDT7041710.1 hypothetical protein [Candidatus Nitronereus thalassa]